MTFNSTSILLQPSPLNVGDDLVPSVWGVIVQLTIRYLPGTPTPLRYSATTEIYEKGGAGTVTLTELPMPPPALRLGVALPYGLTVDFDSLDANIAPGSYGA